MERREFFKRMGVGAAYATIVVARPDALEGQEVSVNDLTDMDLERLRELARGTSGGQEEVYRVDLKDYFNSNANGTRMTHYGVAVTIVGLANGDVEVRWQANEWTAGIVLKEEVEFQTKRMEVKLRERHDAKEVLAGRISRDKRRNRWEGWLGRNTA